MIPEATGAKEVIQSEVAIALPAVASSRREAVS